MNLEEYIKVVHNGNQLWFLEEVKDYASQKRVLDTIRIKKYLSGEHKVTQKVVENYNGKPYEQRVVMLQYGKLIVNLESSHLLKNPLTLVGQDNIITEMNKVYKKGKYDSIDFTLLANLIKYGNAYEYVYVEDNIIKSKVINTENSYPIYNDENVMIAFVEYYETLNAQWYVVYTQDKVSKYSNVGKEDMRLVKESKNISGLPIHYHNIDELNYSYGKSDLHDFMNIIDSMEDLLSKFSDSFYKFHNPIPVVIGQQLKGDGLNQNVVGGGLVLDDNSDFKLVSNQLNHDAFETIYKTLKQELINIASVPSVSLNATDVSNLSETSMKILYQLADIKAGINEKYLRDGLEQRFEKIIALLEKNGKNFSDDDEESLDMVFHYARPVNEKDVIDNLVKLSEINAISKESLLDIAPYITNSKTELERIRVENEEGVGAKK